MADVTVLLISGSNDLASEVRRCVDTIPGLGLAVSGGIDSAYHRSDWDSICLVLIHQSHQSPALEVARLLRMIAATRRPVATVVLAEPYDDGQALTLLRMGVAEYLSVPLDPEVFTNLCDILTLRHRRGRVPTVADPVRPVVESVPTGEGWLVPPAPILPVAGSVILDGNTPQVATLVDQVRRVAPQGATVLLGGETGTGKSHLARQIHELSNRRDEPFLTVNCEDLCGATIEEDLFGLVRGPFGGPAVERKGKFAQAGRGTLFLDGIDALPLSVQAKLLRVVEDRVFEPVGGDQPVPLMARLIAASNRPLDQEIAERRFRSDLFYRLNVVGLQIPPLRERRDAIAPLAQRFLGELTRAYGRDLDPIDGDALHALQEHDWPGNIRELRNVLDRCVAVCPTRTIRRQDLPDLVLEAATRSTQGITETSPLPAALLGASSLARTKGQAEYNRITEALQRHGNNRLRAAGELGISRMTLYKKLYKYGLMERGGRAELLVNAGSKPVY